MSRVTQRTGYVSVMISHFSAIMIRPPEEVLIIKILLKSQATHEVSDYTCQTTYEVSGYTQLAASKERTEKIMYQQSEYKQPGRSFAALDFETATSSRDSACALGVVVFEEGAPTEEKRFLIRPPGNKYDSYNIYIHGIGPETTKDAPELPEVWNEVTAILNGHLVVAHNTAFDMSVLRRSSEYHSYTPEPFDFACTYRVAKSHIPHLGTWRLDHLAEVLNIPLLHHDPLSDAHACGLLWLWLISDSTAARESRTSRKSRTSRADISYTDTSNETDMLNELGYRLGRFDLPEYRPFSNTKQPFSNTKQPFSNTKSKLYKAKPPTQKSLNRQTLNGKKLTFTGTLSSMTRREAFQWCKDSGGKPSPSVTTTTDYLIVGSTNLAVVGKTGMSSKHRQATELINKGRNIKIIDEDEFICLLYG